MNRFTLNDFIRALLGLLPTGPIWNRAPDGTLYHIVKAWAASFLHSSQRAEQLLIEVFPGTTTELLPEWEKTLGLPDINIPFVNTSDEARRADVVLHLTNTGENNLQWYENTIKDRGFNVTLTQCRPLVFGRNFGELFWDAAWNFVWQINASSAEIEKAPGGKSYLEALAHSLTPPHAIVVFNYT